MIERVLLVAWKGSTATGWVDVLKSGGYTVLLEDTTGERAWRTAKERGIDCVIIDGQKKPSHGRQTGHALRDTAKTRDIPIIWTNLDPEDAAGVQTDVKPDRTLTAPTDAHGALAALKLLSSERDHARPAEPSVAEPVVAAAVPAPTSASAARPAPAIKPASKKAAAKPTKPAKKPLKAAQQAQAKKRATKPARKVARK